MLERYLELSLNPLFFVCETLVILALAMWWFRRRNENPEDKQSAERTEEEFPSEATFDEENPSDHGSQPD